MTSTTRVPGLADLADLARQLRDLHRPGEPLVLVNAWDVASARGVVAAGGRAVATTSAGVADTLGLPDDDSSPVAPVFDLLGRIAAAVAVPVSADVAGGYGLPPAELVDRLLAAGLVGCNLEDSDHAGPGALLDASLVADRLAGVRAAAATAGVPLVVNARIDTYLRHAGPAREVLPETLRRARLYLAAGADCVYPVGLGDPAVLSDLVRELEAPVNGNPGDGVTVADLAAAGASRVSVGPRGQRLAQAELRRFAATLLAPSGPLAHRAASRSIDAHNAALCAKRGSPDASVGGWGARGGGRQRRQSS